MLKRCHSRFLLSTCHNLELPEKREPKVKNCPDQIARSQVCKEMLTTVGSTIPRKVGWLCLRQLAEKREEGASKSAAFLRGPASVPA